MNSLNQPVTIVNGKTPSPFPLQLQNGAVLLQEVTIDNTNSPIPILLYLGSGSPQGAPIFVPAGAFRQFPTSVDIACVAFSGPASSNGSAYIEWSDQAGSTAANSVVTISGGNITLQASSVSINGTPTIINTSDYPANATPFIVMTNPQSLGVSGFTAFKEFISGGAVSITAGQKLYLTAVATKGLDVQKIWWFITFYDANGSTILNQGFCWLGDYIHGSLSHPILVGTFTLTGSNAGAQLSVFHTGIFGGEAVVGKLNFAYLLQGYVL